MIERATIEAVLEKALSAGADFAEVFAEDGRRFSLAYSDRKAKNMTRGRDRGAAVRVFYGDRAVHAHTTDIDRESLLRLAGLTAAAGREGASGPLKPLGDFDRREIISVTSPASGTEVGEFLDFARRSDETARAVDPVVVQVSVSTHWAERKILVANSAGVHAGENRSYMMSRVEAVAAEKGEQQAGSEREGSRTGRERFAQIDPEELARMAAERAVRMVRAAHAPAGNMPVLIGNAFGGVIFHEACGHSLETTSVAKGSSVFAGKIGEQIAAECVTAVDDGTRGDDWGTTAIDDEGTPTQRTVLIENGVLRSYMVDRLGGVKTGYGITGSGRRDSYRRAPTSRMRNTYIDAGRDSFDDMVASIDRGLYAKVMGGGSVNPATGEFNFAVNEGYLIEKGKLGSPVRGASLIGFGHEILRRIEMIGGDLMLESGNCGSISGWVPTTVGQPTIKVSEITVGGRS
ncbi:MAG: TldD/PmbA family protein [Planctomycetota bacterium]